jgi:acyl carrier protein
MIAGTVLESMKNCLGMELVEGLGLDSPFIDDLGMDSIELFDLLAVVESKLGIDSEEGAIRRELTHHPRTTIRELIGLIEDAIVRRRR